MDEIEEWERRGFLIRPHETREQYIRRLKEVVEAPSCPTPEVLRQYGLDPGWVPVVYSDDTIYPWEAACAWQEGSRITIQLRKCFETENSYLHFYKKEEILAHEYVHAARFPLHSAKFEEFFAYFLSRSFGSHLRAFLGPFFSKPADTVVFFLMCLTPLASLYFATSTFLLIPLFACGFFGLRLTYTWGIFSRCMQKVGLPLMVRLSDEEIEIFARLTKPEIEAWIQAEKTRSWRWQILGVYK